MKIIATAAFLAITCLMAGAAEPGFTKKPTATRAGDAVKIEFAVDKETDIAVFIENAKGEIVRHLVAGALGGANPPPPPLKPGLSQSVEWDGKADYGKPAEGGPFKVRVALGVGAKYKDVVAGDPLSLSTVKGIAAGPDGTVYVMTDTGNAVLKGETLTAFDREGNYQRTLIPFGPDLKLDEVEGFGAVEIGGRPTLLVRNEARQQIYPRALPQRVGMCVSPDGKRLVILAGDKKTPYLFTITSAGAAVGENPYRELEIEGSAPYHGKKGNSVMTFSSDGKFVYLADFQMRGGSAAGGVPAVYRLEVSSGGGATEVFFGEPARAGSDATHLGGAPGGLAADGKGNLLISDTLNDRVLVVSEKDGKHVGEIKCPKPLMVAAHPASGTVYVASMPGKSGVEIIKFDGWKGGGAVAKLPLRGGSHAQWSMALDAAAKPAVLWVAAASSGGGTPRSDLLRIEDGGAKLESRKVSNYETGAGAFLDVTVDRFRKEVYSRFVGGRGSATWVRFSEKEDKIDKVTCPGGTFAGKGLNLVPHPNGNLYSLRWPCTMKQFDREGKPLAWEKPKHVPLDKKLQGTQFPVKFKAHDTFVPVSMINQPHTLGVRWNDGRLGVLEPGHCGARPPKMLHEYLTTGEKATQDPVVWKVSDSATGPRYDPQGNIYIAEVVRPKGWIYPPELEAHLGAFKPGEKLADDDPKKMAVRWYGSILKFSPKGGMVNFPATGACRSVRDNPFKGEPKLDPELKSTESIYYDTLKGSVVPVKVTGAEWMAPGMSHLWLTVCNCESVTFDVDEFGRSWVPDTGLYRVRVLDTAGNEMLQFGGYGNADSTGDNFGFAWLVGVGATDKYVYCGDSINKRLLRCEITYAAEETCPVK